jgi:O-antigen/teichoic acid export membrane protein
MSDAKNVARNTVFLLSSQIISLLISVLYLKMSMSYLGSTQYGVLTYAQSLTGLFSVVMDLGLTTLVTRDVSRDKSLSKKYLSNVIVIKLMLALLMLGLLFTTVQLRGESQDASYAIYIVAVSVIFTAISQVFYSIFQANERMEYQSYASILNSVMLLVIASAAIYMGLNVLGFALGLLIASAAVLLYCIWICTHKFVKIGVGFDLKFWDIKETIPFGVTAVFGAFFYQIGSVLLDFFKGSDAVGTYNGGFRLFLAVLFVPQVFSSAIFPTMSRFYMTSQDSLRAAFRKFFKYMVILSLPMAVGVTLLADRVLQFMSGDKFSTFTGSIMVLQILIWAAVFIFLSNAYGTVASSSNMQRAAMKIAGICMLLNLILNLVLIPEYSFAGVAVATLLTELASLLLYAWICGRAGFRLTLGTIIDLVKVAAASALMALFILVFRDQSLFILVAAAAVVYFVALYLLRGLDKDDMAILLGYVNRYVIGRKSDEKR